MEISTEGEIVPVEPRLLRRRVLNLAWPVISENFLEIFLGIVDTLLVARLGAEALAGVGASLQVMFFVISALSALSIGSAVLVAQAVGAQNYFQAGQYAKQSLVWSAILAIPLALVGIFLAGPIISIFRMEPVAAQIAVACLQVTMGTVVVLTGLLIGGGALRGAGDSRTPMLVTAIANVVNVGLAYALIFGHFGFPALGAVGSAWATFLARGLALVLLVWALWQGRNGVSLRRGGGWSPDLAVARRIFKLGIPAATEQLLISAAFMTLTILVAGLGTVALAAHRVAFNALSLSFLPGIGFAIAATALVGQSIGAKRVAEAGAVARIANSWAVLWMSLMGVVIFLFAPQLMGFFTEDQEMIAVGAAGLRVVALAQPFWAMLFVYSGALRGMGNTQFPLRVNATGIWLSVGLAYLFVHFFGGQLNAVWSGFLVIAPIMGGLLWWRFSQLVQESISDGTS
jgi:multidrug resistance protein, MATE family